MPVQPDRVGLAAELAFNRTNSMLPNPSAVWAKLDEEEKDFWRDLVCSIGEALGKQAEVRCVCGWEASGEARSVEQMSMFHKCEKTTPSFRDRPDRRDYP